MAKTPSTVRPEGPLRGLHAAAPDEAGAEKGVVVDVLEAKLYRVRLGPEDLVVAHLSSSLRMTPLRLLPGDHVWVQRAKFDPSRGRILRRSVED